MHMYRIEFHGAIFAWFLCSFALPSRALVAYHQERNRMPFHDAFGVNIKRAQLLKSNYRCLDGTYPAGSKLLLID